MPLCSLEQFLAEQLSGSTFKVLLDVMFLYSRNALKVAFLDGGSWFFFTSHKSASLGKKPKINKDYSIYRFLFPAIEWFNHYENVADNAPSTFWFSRGPSTVKNESSPLKSQKHFPTLLLQLLSFLLLFCRNCIERLLSSVCQMEKS